MSPDPLIGILKEHSDALRVFALMWDLGYVDGRAPDAGSRRKTLFKLLLKYELGLKIEDAPSYTVPWDFRVKLNGEDRFYKVKTTRKTVGILKVGWASRIDKKEIFSLSFTNPIIHITRPTYTDLHVYLYSPENLEKTKTGMGREFWWIPNLDQDYRGFGISREGVAVLQSNAIKEGNYIHVMTPHIDPLTVKEEYWKGLFAIVKSIILRATSP